MIDENLKAKELCTAGTKEDPLYGCQDASSRASSMSRLFRDITPPQAGCNTLIAQEDKEDRASKIKRKETLSAVLLTGSRL